MEKSLTKVARQLKNSPKKAQLIYAFNGIGKTRLSREFKQLVAPKTDKNIDVEARTKILYYNAFTEDLFYWDNDLELDTKPKLKIQPNTFTSWVFQDQGQDQNIVANFQRYTNEKLTPHFNGEYHKDEKDPKSKVEAFSEVTFSFERGDDKSSGNVKISKGEERNFIWSIFYSLLEQVVDVLNAADPSKREMEQFIQLEYIFIDDPVSSLDENRLIELAVDLAQLIKSDKSELKFIITTHNPLFYNVLHNELNAKACYMLGRNEDGTFDLEKKEGDSNQSFSYHLFLKRTLEQAIERNEIQKYHFTLLRNLYEKTAAFLGYQKWSDLLRENDRQLYYQRIINFTSHSTLSNETVAEPTEPEKQIVKFLLDNLINNYGFCKQVEKND